MPAILRTNYLQRTAPGRAAAARAHAKPLAVWPPGRLRRKFCGRNSAWKFWLTSSRCRKSSAEVNPDKVTFKEIEANIVRCPNPLAAEKMIRLIEKMRREGNTVGGIVEGIARGVPAGWGEPVFDKLEADLAKAMLSLPASKAFEIGSGFGGILLTGREHNDAFRARNKKVFTTTNRSGGIQGGISNGETIFFRTAFKPVATVMHEQDTVYENLENTTLKGRGRHDPCVLPRAVPMVEAMTALVLVDHALRHKAQCG